MMVRPRKSRLGLLNRRTLKPDPIIGFPFQWLPRWNRGWDVGCVKCAKPAWHEHHITYTPEEKVPLCIVCHEIITRMNGAEGLRLRVRLTNATRKRIWREFLSGSNTG